MVYRAFAPVNADGLIPDELSWRQSGWDFDRFLQPCLYYGARSTERTTGRPLLGKDTNQFRTMAWRVNYLGPIYTRRLWGVSVDWLIPVLLD